jgi:hypothetical protein
MCEFWIAELAGELIFFSVLSPAAFIGVLAGAS